MKRIYIVLSFVILLLISFLGITYSYEYNENEYLKFNLIGDYKLNLDLFSEYVEYGINVTYNGEDISSLVNIDSSMVNVNKVGEYKVKYEVNIDGMLEYVYRIVRVTETVKPEITLKGDSIVNINVNDVYVEPGYEVIDNYDGNLTEKVIITSNLDESHIGEYNIEYKVTDSSGNETIVNRIVIVS